MIPADYVTNCSLATGWEVGRVKAINENEEKNEREIKYEDEVPVYNIISSVESKITWGL